MKNKKLIIVIAVLVLVVLIIFIINKNKSKPIQNEIQNKKEVNTLYDNETGLYYVKNDRNEIMAVSIDEEDLEFYKKNPDYNPNPLSSPITDLNSYMYSEYEFNNEIEY